MIDVPCQHSLSLQLLFFRLFDQSNKSCCLARNLAKTGKYSARPLKCLIDTALWWITNIDLPDNDIVIIDLNQTVDKMRSASGDKFEMYSKRKRAKHTAL